MLVRVPHAPTMRLISLVIELIVSLDYGRLFITYLLLAECEVCTASYGPSFCLPFMA